VENGHLNHRLLDFACPICKVPSQEKCQLMTGAPRFSSHVERVDVAKDYNRDIEPTEHSSLDMPTLDFRA
jgi:hypothetical protein